MKTIKVKHVGFYPEFVPEYDPIYRSMKKFYDVQISDDPDYVICSVFGDLYSYCEYPQVRILSCGENYTPDFNLVDYALCRYPIQFGDRCFWEPGCVYPTRHWLSLPEKDRNYPADILKEKPYFANFIASHESEYGIRGDFFKKLSEYKRVESPGSYLNNMPDGKTVSWSDGSKTDFQRKCKFTLCFESTSNGSFITEKITDAFYSDSIPVYYGSETVADIFNKDAFINCADYPSFEAVIEKIKELDQDDEKYLAMLRQPILKDPSYPQRVYDDLEAWVRHIVDQPLEKAYRRSRIFFARNHDEWLKNASRVMPHPLRAIVRSILGRFGLAKLIK